MVRYLVNLFYNVPICKRTHKKHINSVYTEIFVISVLWLWANLLVGRYSREKLAVVCYIASPGTDIVKTLVPKLDLESQNAVQLR